MQVVSYVISDPDGNLMIEEFTTYAEAVDMAERINDGMWDAYDYELTDKEPQGSYAVGFKYDDGTITFDLTHNSDT